MSSSEKLDTQAFELKLTRSVLKFPLSPVALMPIRHVGSVNAHMDGEQVLKKLKIYDQ